MARLERLEAVQVYEFRDGTDGKTYRWNATAGRRLAETRGATIEVVYLKEAGLTAGTLQDFAPDLDWRKVRMLPGEALLVPLLWVPHKAAHVCIDGRHGIAKAIREGYPCLPAYLLTQEEADAIRMAEAPS